MVDDVILKAVVGGLLTYLFVKREWTVARKLRGAAAWAVFAFLFYSALPWDRENLYTLLDVSPRASRFDIQTAYRTASKKYHPDKNPEDENAEENFSKVKKAYDTLVHETLRSNYDRFGDVKMGEIDEKQVMMIMSLSAVTHVLLYCIGFFLTYPRPFRFARQIFVVYSIACFCMELQFRFVENDESFDWIPLVCNILPYEKVRLFRDLFPAILVFSLIWSNYLYVDNAAITTYLLKGIINTNRVLLDRVQEILKLSEHVKKLGTPSAAAMKFAAQQMNAKSAAVQLVQRRGGQSALPADGTVGEVDEAAASSGMLSAAAAGDDDDDSSGGGGDSAVGGNTTSTSSSRSSARLKTRAGKGGGGGNGSGGEQEAKTKDEALSTTNSRLNNKNSNSEGTTKATTTTTTTDTTTTGGIESGAAAAASTVPVSSSSSSSSSSKPLGRLVKAVDKSAKMEEAEDNFFQRFGSFTDSLTSEQREQFKKFIDKQVELKDEGEKKGTFNVNWSQLVLCGALLYVWAHQK